MYKVLILAGSSAHNSHTLNLCKNIETSLKKLNIEIDLIDLVEYKLPQYDLSEERNMIANNSKVKNFIELTKNADGYIWGTPVYHGSYSGILKNALDWQHFFLKDKIVGLASNGNERGSMAVDHLTLVARTQHAIAIPTRVCTHRTDYDDQNQLIQEGILNRVETFSKEYFEFLEKFRVS